MLDLFISSQQNHRVVREEEDDLVLPTPFTNKEATTARINYMNCSRSHCNLVVSKNKRQWLSLKYKLIVVNCFVIVVEEGKVIIT